MVGVLALVGQLGAVGALAGVSYGLNKLRPPNIRYRPLKLTAWIPALILGCLLINFLVKIDIASNFFPTPDETRTALRQARSVCTDPKSTFEEIRTAMYNRPKPSAEFLSARRGPIEQLEPIINQVLFSLGVAFVSIPVWIRLLFLGLRRLFKLGSTNDSDLAPLRAEWGILLPLVNVTTTLTVFTSPFYFFYLAPNRTFDCVYTSGHWYTTGCTLLGFCIVISHILSYLYGDDILGRRSKGESTSETRKHMKSVLGALLQFYLVIIVIYLLLVSLVLRVTQQLYHDDFEANTGLKRSTESFLFAMILVIVVQYVTFTVTSKSQKRAALLVPSATLSTTSTIPPPSSTTSQSSSSSSSSSKTASPLRSSTSEQPSTQPAPSEGVDLESTLRLLEEEADTFSAELEALIPHPEDEAPQPPQSPLQPDEDAPLPPPAKTSSSAASVPAPPPPPPPPMPVKQKQARPQSQAKPTSTTKQTGNNSRQDLLAAISSGQAGQTLRKTSSEPRKPQEGGLAGVLSASLSKIRFVVQPDQEEDDDEDWGNEDAE